MLRSLKTMVMAGSVGIGLLAAGTAHAAIVPTLAAGSPSGAGPYTWTYEAILHPDTRVENGDFFTIYDFAGFIGGSNTQPAGWSFASSNVTAPPAGVVPFDNPTLPNLTWTRTGGTITPPNNLTAVSLGNFSANSQFNLIGTADFVSRTTKIGGHVDGTKVGAIGEIEVPSNVPEPATMALLGLGAAPLIGRLRRRSRKA